MEDENIAIGNILIELLGLTVKENGRVDTTWGDKTPAGLTLTVKRIIDENEISEDLADHDLFECDCCGDTFDNDFSMRVGTELYCEGCVAEQTRRDKKNGLFGGELDISN